MSKEQKELLLKIAELIVKDFNLEMKDHWSSDDYSQSLEYSMKKDELEKEYEKKYGELKQWNGIDDVYDTVKQLRKELQE